ncbi:penicillin-binding protein 1A [Pseudoduganella namucuonensis]|uniref:Penicillin-binding protein 1A n=1 Tax=Pseudoduganella namucuonensis TaxID=1035707 RepID=A0A1I7L4K7_9BURK|nr:PBP1A family penicillin-binding protein [Pseudoduganella namucuonensis]SFV04640.1 penicillin-binding protein 1A [Pseudoduganella namucuonensis]
MAGIASAVGAAALAGYMLLVVAPNLPALDAVTDYRPKIPLRVYTADNELIGEFGEEHRDFVAVKDTPEMMKKAILAIEDTRFYDHGGIDWIRALGAVRSNLRGSFRQGGSTITMQVARNFFLSRDKVLGRKMAEVMLAYKIEAALSKDQILELYMNQIYLGQRSYGFGSAAQTYFSKPLKELSIAEMAMLAGLPKNPSRHNPAVNPQRARLRQHVVLGRMRDVGYITEAQYQQALKEPLRVSAKGQEFDTHAEYVAELARQVVYEQFKEESYTRGISVYTTILKADQDAAYESVRRNVLAYDQRHGYRGPEAFIDLPSDPEEREDAIDEALQKRRSSDRLVPAVVTSATSKLVRVETIDGEELDISGEGLKLATPALGENAKPAVKLRPGAIVRVVKSDKRGGKPAWAIAQVPQVAAAFVSIDSNTGAYHAMVGGFDYNLQKFNHVTQAWRQPGSAIKPFVYSAALEKGYFPGTLIGDTPLDLGGGENGQPWRPQNDDGVYDGAVTMRTSLAKSKNVTSIRLLRAVGVPYAHDYLAKFGFDPAKHPQNLTMTLGTGSVTPQQMAAAYAVFANGGYQVQPYLIARIVDGDGKVISETKAPQAAQEGNRVLDPRNVFITDGMLREVTRSGTGAAAAQRLGRYDIAGKTGTTNDAVDGWFAGYGGGVVGVAWMGYDDPKSLGGREFGATLAMPIWVDYMKVALAKLAAVERAAPEGVTQVDGEWMYSEYVDDPSVRTIDMELPPPSAPAADEAPIVN